MSRAPDLLASSLGPAPSPTLHLQPHPTPSSHLCWLWTRSYGTGVRPAGPVPGHASEGTSLGAMLGGCLWTPAPHTCPASAPPPLPPAIHALWSPLKVFPHKSSPPTGHNDKRLPIAQPAVTPHFWGTMRVLSHRHLPGQAASLLASNPMVSDSTS